MWAFDIHYEGTKMILLVVTDKNVMQYEMNSLTDINPKRTFNYALSNLDTIVGDVEIETNG